MLNQFSVCLGLQEERLRKHEEKLAKEAAAEVTLNFKKLKHYDVKFLPHCL